MRNKILLAPIFQNERFDTEERRQGLDKLAKLGDLELEPSELTEDDADGVVGVIASSALIHPSFYQAAKKLRVISRWGVGYENTNYEIAAQHGVIVTIAPEHMVTVAE